MEFKSPGTKLAIHSDEKNRNATMSINTYTGMLRRPVQNAFIMHSVSHLLLLQNKNEAAGDAETTSSVIKHVYWLQNKCHHTHTSKTYTSLENCSAAEMLDDTQGQRFAQTYNGSVN